MSEPNALVSFRLDRDKPLRLKWIATDGVPGDGYKAQVKTIRFSDGSQLNMDSTAILEQCAADPAGGIGGYMVSFNGMVGFASDHPERVERRLAGGDRAQRPADQFGGGDRAAGQLIELLADGRKPRRPAQTGVSCHGEVETNGAGPRLCRNAVGNWSNAAVSGSGGRAAPAQAR